MKIDSEKIEKELRNSILEYTERVEIQSQMSEAFHIWKNDAYSISEYSEDYDIDDETFTKFYDWFIFDFKTFNNKKRVVEEFYLENIENFNDDEKSVLEEWIKSYQSYFEVIKINQDESCIIKDIFTSDEILVYDKVISSKIRTFDIISARPLKTGDKFFFSGIISVFPNIFKQLITEHFNKEFEAYKMENTEIVTEEAFLKDFGYIIGNYIEDIINHPQLISVDGEEFVVAMSNYSVSEKESVLNILNISEELIVIQKSQNGSDYYFLNDFEGIDVGANIEIDDKNLTITCNTKSKLQSARSFIESILGDFIDHNNDNIRKLDSYIEKSKKNRYNLPKGFRSRKKYESTLDDFYTNWIDQPLDALDGLTPRQALRSPEGRDNLEKILLELEKLYDSARKAGEPYYEVSRLRELLLNSLN